MPCECSYADERDGDTAIFHPLQVGGQCSARSCQAPRPREREQQHIEEMRRTSGGCSECAWGRVAGCWRCGSR